MRPDLTLPTAPLPTPAPPGPALPLLLVGSPTRLVVSGVDDAILGNAIVIANHQTFADWWYMWCWAYTKNQHGSFKIILKNSLKNIPIWGWVRPRGHTPLAGPAPRLIFGADLLRECSALPC